MFSAYKAKLGSKMAMGTVAFAAPIFLGVAFTGGTGIDAGSLFGDTEDQWTISIEDGQVYTLDRTEISGVVELIVTDPQGDVVASDEYPEFVAEAAAEFGAADWMPEEFDLFEIVDGKACYDAGKLAQLTSDEPQFGAINSSSEQTFALEAYADGEIDAAFFEGEVSNAVLNDHRAAGGRYTDLNGATELDAC